MEKQDQIVIYQTKEGSTEINVRLENETVWLTQSQLVELFQRDQSVISRHINNIFREGELEKKSNMHFLHIANSDKPVALYNLDIIISVGYRVKSHRGTQFRIWANRVLKEYLVKGYALNEKRLKETRQKFLELKQSIGLLENVVNKKSLLFCNEKDASFESSHKGFSASSAVKF